MTVVRSIAGSFSAVVGEVVQEGLPYDPLGIACRSLKAGFSFCGRYTVADAGYGKYCHQRGRLHAQSRHDGGLVAVNFLFGSAVYVQSGTSFSHIGYLSSLRNEAYDQQELNANNAASSGTFTQTMLCLSLQRPVTGASLHELVDTPFQAESGMLEFHEYENQELIGGFTARITQANFG